MAARTLLLSLDRFEDEQHWHWRLSTEQGRVLGEHEAELDPSAPEYEAFFDLDNYLRIHAAPDQRDVDERRILERVGAWVRSEVLGELAERILELRLPVAVRVLVPSPAAKLMYCPLELARTRGKSLGEQDVTFVFQLAPDSPPVELEAIGASLRILAVFSAPVKTSPLGVRHERVLLQQMLSRLATKRSIDFRVLQYGVTIDSLKKVLREGAGWDLVHVSGHGRAGMLLLEGKDGTCEPLGAQRLVELLMLARSRLKCVTLSSCLSAVDTLSEARTWIGLQGVREDPAIERAEDTAASPEAGWWA